MGNNMPSLSHVLPYDTAPLQNLRTLIRLHITARFNNKIGLKLKCGMLDRPASEVNVESSRNPVGWEGNDTTVMRFLGDLHPIVLGGVGELRMEGFVGSLEPQVIDLLKFFEGVPTLAKLITADGNEQAFRSALDDLGYRAAVVKAGARSRALISFRLLNTIFEKGAIVYTWIELGTRIYTAPGLFGRNIYLVPLALHGQKVTVDRRQQY